MAKKNAVKFDTSFSFYQQLWEFYSINRGKIRSRYKDLTRKFLAYNDAENNPKAFLRKPQFQALEMYVFIKEFMDNQHVYEMFDDWVKHENKFSNVSYYAVNKDGQYSLFEESAQSDNKIIFENMKQFKESYPNYIYALTMGLGKTILIATCIFYDFLLANKFPKDKRFCHNALVFAPDKTVLESLREIITFDKTKVVPPEYARVLDSNVKFHFLEDTGVTLNTIDGSDFNLIISNNQKIIVKKKRAEDSPADKLFDTGSLLSEVYGDLLDGEDDDVWDDATLMDNQRFKKLCRLPQLGVYVDEAHHLFGANLEKELRSGKNGKTTLRNTINLLASSTSIVACYNYTGTPYVNKQVLPEVVYAYGLSESISNGYLKDANPVGYENVKSEEFLRQAITRFWTTYGDKTYEGLTPKLAIFASGVPEAVDIVRPTVEKVLSELNIPINKILVNVGDEKITKNEDIRNFNNLDKAGTEGNEKQFIILVEKGREGWNCRSLLGIAMYRSPKSKVFVLQATMRCLRQLSDEQLKATIFLSKDNYDTLDEELQKNYNMDISGLGKKEPKNKYRYRVTVMEPSRIIKIKRMWHEYSLENKVYSDPINFGLDDFDFAKYEATRYEKSSIRLQVSAKEEKITDVRQSQKYSAYSLIGEISKHLNVSCLQISKIMNEAQDGIETIVDAINKYNDILYDVVIPKVFHALFSVNSILNSDDRNICLLRYPKEGNSYEFIADPELVITKGCKNLTPTEVKKSFHADTYCFDSKPEKECFLQYISSDKVKEIYFTGMFTAGQGDLAIPYFDPESKRVRLYYPDFIARMVDDTYQLIEVKGDNKIDDVVVKAKQEAAEELSAASGMKYIIYKSSTIMKHNVLERDDFYQNNSLFDE